MLVWGIKNCDTVKKARRWLDNSGIEYQFRDFRSDGLTTADVTRWLKSVSWQELLNTKSRTWRQLPEQRRSGLDRQAAISLMLDQPTLIKRPVVETNNVVLVGFSAERYKALCSGL
jgi:arsenate reductase